MISNTWVAPPVGSGSAGHAEQEHEEDREALLLEELDEAPQGLLAVALQPALELATDAERLGRWRPRHGGDDKPVVSSPPARGHRAFSLCRLLSKAFVLREERVMKGRGRWVLSFVFACALIGALAPAAGAHHGATQRSSDFDRGWKFALVNRTDITDPTGAYANAADPGYDDGPWRAVDLPHDWSIELDPTPDGHDQRHRLLPGRPGLVPQDLHAPALGRAARASRSSSTASTWTPSSSSTASRSPATPTATPASRST